MIKKFKAILEHMRYTNQFKITTSWFTKALKGQSSNFHNHNNSMYSAVLYLQTDENSGAISFTMKIKDLI